MDDKQKQEKIIMMVNGEPIDMCPRTLSLCNKRMQALLQKLKVESREKTHTLRFYWGDVIMLNIITNQMLQHVDARALGRIVKPVNSIKEDLEEYQTEREKRIEKLRDVIITANDDKLPLDYSRELEKYYREEISAEDTLPEQTENKPLSDDVSEQDIIKETIEADTLSTNKAAVNQQDKPLKTIQQSSKQEKKTHSVPPKFHDTHSLYVDDSSEEEVVFGDSFKPHVDNKTEDVPPSSNEKDEIKDVPVKKITAEEEIQKHQNAFSNFGEMDFNALFQ